MDFARNLRSLRLQHAMTQSALAERLGVSDRAVSRWERGEAFPDITLLPPLSMLLHVSVDALLGVDSQRRQSAISEALIACNAAMQHGSPHEAAATLRAALSAYPDEPELMVALARTLMAFHTDEAAREALALCRAADGKPARLSTAYGCKQVMALALHQLGRSEQAAQLVSDELPSFWVCREVIYPRVAPPDKAEGQREFNLLWLVDQIHSTLKAMAKERTPEQAVALLETAVRIYRDITGSHAGMYEERISRTYLRIMELYQEMGNIPSSAAAWDSARAAAEAYAGHDGSYVAPWLDRIHDDPAAREEAEALMAKVRDTAPSARTPPSSA